MFGSGKKYIRLRLSTGNIFCRNDCVQVLTDIQSASGSAQDFAGASSWRWPAASQAREGSAAIFQHRGRAEWRRFRAVPDNAPLFLLKCVQSLQGRGWCPTIGGSACRCAGQMLARRLPSSADWQLRRAARLARPASGPGPCRSAFRPDPIIRLVCFCRTRPAVLVTSEEPPQTKTTFLLRARRYPGPPVLDRSRCSSISFCCLSTHPRAPQEFRIISSTGNFTTSCELSLPESRSRSSSLAILPISYWRTRTVVSAGSTSEAMAISSKPTTATSRGILRSSWRQATIAPTAIRSL